MNSSAKGAEVNKASRESGGQQRQPITDVTAWLKRQRVDVLPTLRALGQLLVGVAEEGGSETAECFTARCLGVTSDGRLLEEELSLNPVSRLTIALVLAEWIETHSETCEIGSGEIDRPPKWTQTDIGGHRYRHPICLRVHFPAGTLVAETGCVIAIEARESLVRSAEVSVFVTPIHHAQARTIMERLVDRANELNPYRGHAVRATHRLEISFTPMTLPAGANRESVIAPDAVWAEIDLSVRAVRDRHELLNAHGLGARRGVLLCGPPGTGKSAISAVVARELVGDFTVIYVEARAGTELLSAVVREARRLGGPGLLVLEDVDLWCRDRATGPSGLSELLQAMDIEPQARILTIASTNDATTLDKAAIRTGRFDSIIEIGYPDKAVARRILSAHLRDIPGGPTIDVDAVVAALPEHTSGSDIREIIRRAVLTVSSGDIDTAALVAEVRAGRYLATVPTGLYL